LPIGFLEQLSTLEQINDQEFDHFMHYLSAAKAIDNSFKKQRAFAQKPEQEQEGLLDVE
jgi:hypothetical protein